MAKAKRDVSARKKAPKGVGKPKRSAVGARKSSPLKGRESAKTTSKKASVKRRISRNAVQKAPRVPVFVVQELDPRSKCGPGTSVQRLFRLREEDENGAVHSHMVFLDRHGWYCEHGRNCPAVPHAKKVR